jgi:hypothetical protein
MQSSISERLIAFLKNPCMMSKSSVNRIFFVRIAKQANKDKMNKAQKKVVLAKEFDSVTKIHAMQIAIIITIVLYALV